MFLLLMLQEQVLIVKEIPDKSRIRKKFNTDPEGITAPDYGSVSATLVVTGVSDLMLSQFEPFVSCRLTVSRTTCVQPYWSTCIGSFFVVFL
jgi:hypothetical protein